MQFLIMAVFAVLVVAVDQLVKFWTVSNIALHEQIPAIEGLFRLTYVQNTGAAFSAFRGAQWLFILVFAVLTVALVYEYFFKQLPFTKWERWCIAAVYGGGIGNVIDRIRLGYVVDMIEVEFINFPVFNVADCFITCGCIALLVHLVFFNKEFWKEEKPQKAEENHDSDS